MGSDMAMEKIHVERYARWEMVEDVQYLSIYRRSSYDNTEQLLWRGEPNEHNEDLIKILVAIIPDRPEPVLTLRTQIRNILNDQVDGFETQFFTEQHWQDIVDSIMEAVDDSSSE
jgi:hypothetical protein